MFSPWSLPVLGVTAAYQAIATLLENQQQPPGQLMDVGGHRLHMYRLASRDPASATKPTVVIEHSLGGVEGYLLINEIARFAEVCLCDRAGYGWSDISRRAMTSEERVRSLDIALTQANIKPPYLLVGNSLGSYHMRLYAHRFPEKVVGMVLTDGLHEKALLKMPIQLRAIQAVFFAGFVMSILGSALGIVRIAANVGGFSLLKPQLKKFPPAELQPVLHSFCRPKHWLTMAREIAQLDNSGKELIQANDFGNLPIVSIKARDFFKPTWLTRCLPLRRIEQLRAEMHKDLMSLSTGCTQLLADHSSHFVWIDQPETIVQAVEIVLEQVRTSRKFNLKIPNETTQAAIDEAKTIENLESFENISDLYS
jgi:pimeloyl-ACP methyl ester carboxylesterase